MTGKRGSKTIFFVGVNLLFASAFSTGISRSTAHLLPIFYLSFKFLGSFLLFIQRLHIVYVAKF